MHNYLKILHIFETFNKNNNLIWEALLQTVVMVIVASIFLVLIGFTLGTIMFYTHNDGPRKNKPIYFIVSTIVNIIRSIPFLILIVIIMPLTTLIVGKSYGVAASIVPLSIIGSAIFARVVEQNFLSLPTSLTDTAFALGANSFQSFFYFYLKEASSGLVLGLTSSIVSLISYSTVMGVVGGGGIGDLAIRYALIDYDYNMMIIALILVILVVQVVQVIGNLTARLLDKKQYRTQRR